MPPPPTLGPRTTARATIAAAEAPAPGRSVLRLPAERVRQAGDVLARAFHEDPLMQYALPDPRTRAKAMPGPFRSLVRFALREGLAYTTPGGEGAALWVAPGNYPPRTGPALRAGFPLWGLHLGREGLRRIEHVLGAWEPLHARNVPSLHWYLWVLGVDPAHQGQGIGSSLMRPVLQRADMQGVPCYLETCQPRNLALYRRHGFEVVDEVRLGGGAPVSWTMRREPAAARDAMAGR